MSKALEDLETAIIGEVPSAEGAAFFIQLKDFNEDKTASIAKAKGLKRAGELLSGSRVTKLKDTAADRAVMSKRWRGVADKSERAAAAHEKDFISGVTPGVSRSAADSKWHEASSIGSRASFNSKAYKRLSEMANKESNKVNATQLGAALTGTGALVAGADYLDKKAAVNSKSSKPSILGRYGELLTGSRARKAGKRSESALRSSNAYLTMAATADAMKRKGYASPEASDSISGRGRRVGEALRIASDKLKNYGKKEERKVTATRLGTGAGLLGAGVLAKKLITKRASVDVARSNLVREVSEAGDAAKALQVARAAKDSDLREKGRERAVTNLSAEAHRDKGRRGERFGGAIGSAGGALAGGALGKDFKTRAAGAALGYLVGGKAGKTVGEEVDIRKNASLKMAAGVIKMALEGQTPGMDQAQAPGPVTEEGSPQAAAPQPPPEQPAPEGPPPGSRQMEPTNYLEAEQAARAAQEVSEAAFYRQRMHEAIQGLQGAQDELTTTQGQLQALQETSSAVNDQITQKTQQAVEANVLATQQVQAAADMRIGLEKIRQQMLQVASQDPSVLAVAPPPPVPGEAAGGAPPPEGGQQPEGGPPQGGPPQGGVPGQEPSPPDGGEPSNPKAPAGAKKPQLSVKVGSPITLKSMAPWAAGGAAVGGVGSFLASRASDEVRAGLELAKQQHQPGNYESTQALAKQYTQMAEAEKADKSPALAVGVGAMTGGASMAMLGPQLVPTTKKLIGNLRNLRNIRR